MYLNRSRPNIRRNSIARISVEEPSVPENEDIKEGGRNQKITTAKVSPRITGSYLDRRIEVSSHQIETSSESVPNLQCTQRHCLYIHLVRYPYQESNPRSGTQHHWVKRHNL